KRFSLLTDHKAIEHLKSKLDFGSSRIQRWFQRFERFSFDIIYVKGEKIITSDALSRAFGIKVKQDEGRCIDQRIMNYHKNMNHRKRIKDDLLKIGIFTTERKIKRIISKCETCLKIGKKNNSSGEFIWTHFPGERVAFDIMEIGKNDLVLLGIDYFSRKIFGKAIKTKDAQKVLRFIKEVHLKFPIKCLLTDNGKEFHNNLLRNWCISEGIQHIFSVPYYHESNGRIERANRTIREAIKHTNGLTSQILSEIIDNYNNSIHRATGITPNNGLLNENQYYILTKQNMYAKEFKLKKSFNEKFELFDKVMIWNELKQSKMDCEFRETGFISKILGKNTYEVDRDKGGKIIRHSSQLKSLKEGDVGCITSLKANKLGY
ncbi:Gag-Pol polyprotein, partial [Dictyocoela muelleri]